MLRVDRDRDCLVQSGWYLLQLYGDNLQNNNRNNCIFFRLSQQNVKKFDNFLLNAENNTFPYKYPKEEKYKFPMPIIKK